jgi:hypothetical protein
MLNDGVIPPMYVDKVIGPNGRLTSRIMLSILCPLQNMFSKFSGYTGFSLICFSTDALEYYLFHLAHFLVNAQNLKVKNIFARIVHG